MKSHEKESFGEFLKNIRKELCMTQTQFAARLNIDAANLSKMENDKRDFDEKKLKALSELSGIDFDEVKSQYFGNLIARKLYYSDCKTEIFKVAEEKLNYLKSKNTAQSKINFQ